MADDNTLLIIAQGEFEDVLRKFEKLQGEIRETEVEAERLGADPVDIDVDPAIGEIRRIRDEVERLAKDAEDPLVIKAKTKEATQALRLAKQELRKVKGAAKDAKDEVRKLGKADVGRLNKAMRNLSGAVSSFTGNLAARVVERFFDAVAQGALSALKTRAALDGLEPALRQVAGGYDGAALSAEFLEDVSARLARPISELTPAFVRLAGATKGTAAEGELTRQLFDSLNQAGVALGSTTVQLQGAMLGLSQVAGRDVLKDLEDVRQVTDALPGVFDAWARSLGLTQSALRDQIEKGIIPTEEALKGLDQAFRDVAGTATAERLETLGGKLSQIGTAAESLGQTFTGELEPGLKAVLDEIIATSKASDALAAALGATADSSLRDLAAALALARGESESLREGFNALEELQPLREFTADVLRATGALKPLGEFLDTFGDRLQGIPEASAAAFGELEKDAVLAAQGIEDATSEAAEGAAGSFVELAENAKASFREQAEAAGASAESIKRIEKELGEELVAINDATAKDRQALADFRLRAAEEGVDKIEELDATLAKRLRTLADKTAKDQAKAIQERVKAAQAATREEERLAQETAAAFDRVAQAAADSAEERIETERRAADAIAAEVTRSTESALEGFDRLAEGAGASADERRNIAAALADELAEIENDAAAKIEKIREEFLEKAAGDGEARVEAEKSAAEKIEKIEVELAQKREGLISRRLDAIKAATDREIAEVERLRENILKLSDEIGDAFDKIGKAGEGAADVGGEGGDVELPIARALDDVLDNVEELRRELDELTVGPGFDPEKFSDLSLRLIDARANARALGGASTEAAEEFQTATGSMEERSDALLDSLGELVRENEAFRDTFAGLDDATAAALTSIIQQFETLAKTSGVTQGDVDQLQASIEAILGTAGETGEGVGTLAGELDKLRGEAERTGEGAKRTAEGVREAADGITAAEGASEGLRDALKSWREEARGSADEMAGAGEAAGEAADGIAAGGEAAATAAEGVGALGDEAAVAAEGVESIAAAAERLGEVAVPEELPAQLAAIGTAAGETAAATDPLAEGLERVDSTLAAILASAAALVEALPDLNASATESGEAAKQIADDDAIGKIGEQLEKLKTEITAVAPLIGETAEGLERIGEQGDPVSTAAGKIAKALAALAGSELVEGLRTFIGLLGEIRTPLVESEASAAKLHESIEQLASVSESVREAISGMAKAFSEEMPEAAAIAVDSVNEVAQAFRDLKSVADEAFRSIRESIDATRAGFQGMAQDIERVAAALRDAASATRELADAQKELNPEVG